MRSAVAEPAGTDGGREGAVEERREVGLEPYAGRCGCMLCVSPESTRHEPSK